jgi:large subunit ribosomal protein L23
VNPHQVLRRPLVTEKSTVARDELNVVTFAVDPRANKHEIRHAVETLFDVKVLDVRTMRMPRKSRRLGRFVGRRAEWKKAVVRLAQGQKIEFFEGV